jgi:hypothetical protein
MSKKATVLTLQQAQAAIIRYDRALHTEFAVELESSPPDWEHLVFLRDKIDALERRAPWRKQLA